MLSLIFGRFIGYYSLSQQQQDLISHISTESLQKVTYCNLNTGMCSVQKFHAPPSFYCLARGRRIRIVLLIKSDNSYAEEGGHQ